MHCTHRVRMAFYNTYVLYSQGKNGFLQYICTVFTGKDWLFTIHIYCTHRVTMALHNTYVLYSQGNNGFLQYICTVPTG